LHSEHVDLTSEDEGVAGPAPNGGACSPPPSFVLTQPKDEDEAASWKNTLNTAQTKYTAPGEYSQKLEYNVDSCNRINFDVDTQTFHVQVCRKN